MLFCMPAFHIMEILAMCILSSLDFVIESAGFQNRLYLWFVTFYTKDTVIVSDA